MEAPVVIVVRYLMLLYSRRLSIQAQHFEHVIPSSGIYLQDGHLPLVFIECGDVDVRQGAACAFLLRRSSSLRHKITLSLSEILKLDDVAGLTGFQIAGMEVDLLTHVTHLQS